MGSTDRLSTQSIQVFIDHYMHHVGSRSEERGCQRIPSQNSGTVRQSLTPAVSTAYLSRI
jgi:hypothetical protein